MAIELLFGRKNPGVIGQLTLDATISERQSFRNEVTSFPIESGSVISDHVIQAPEEIEITGFVTNTPIEFLSGLRTSGQDWVSNAYLQLLDIAGYDYPDQVFRRGKLETTGMRKETKFELIDIVSSLRTYSDMALISLDIPRDAKSGDSVKFTALFRKVKTVELTEVPRTVVKVNATPAPAATTAPQQTPNTTDGGKAGMRESILHKGKVQLLGK
jgi:hypothetical protein